MLVERVRARLARVVADPCAVQVSVDASRTVRLAGFVLAWEREPLLRAIAVVPGILGVRDELEVHESARSVGARQGVVRTAETALPQRLGSSSALRVLMALAAAACCSAGHADAVRWGRQARQPGAHCCCAVF